MQAIAIARGLIDHPKIVLADEPTGNLDPVNKQQILELLLGYRDRYGASMLTVTHDHGLLDRFDHTIDVGCFQAQGSVPS